MYLCIPTSVHEEIGSPGADEQYLLSYYLHRKTIW